MSSNVGVDIEEFVTGSLGLLLILPSFTNWAGGMVHELASQLTLK